MRIGIDLMGSDSPPSRLLEAAELAAEELQGRASLVALASHEALRDLPKECGIELFPTEEEITMDDLPLVAIRRKRLSSLVWGMRLLKSKELDGFVSAGNTGALIAAAALLLPALPTISRPALLATLPTLHGNVAVIDIGGNVSCKPSHLLQFARMGAAYKRCVDGITAPRVGLLNIGTESQKGTSGVREAYDALLLEKNPHFTFIGNIEGREAFSGVVDVLVCDGFSGNVFLKTAEGISSFILSHLDEALGPRTSPEVEAALSSLARRVNYAEYPGAIICGVEGVVIKCHGFSSTQAMCNGIKGACNLIENALIQNLKAALTATL